MEVKWLEIRDRGTLIPAFAFTTAQFYEAKDAGLIKQAGFAIGEHYVILGRFHESAMNWDSEEWGDVRASPPERTMTVAHRWISRNWAGIQSGDVIDVEFILGDTDRPKTSDV